MAKAKKVITIEAAKPIGENGLTTSKLRVCAYCRVSTTHEDQLNSFSAQCSFYDSFIKSHPEWEYAGIYADEGISGKSKHNRTEFLRMLEAARNHAFDLVLTKSISRFARNTTDCLEAVRELKQLGIGIFFEKENINTLSADSELLLTILSSIAAEELNNLSENIRWSKQRQFKEGKVLVCTTRFMGYDMNENGELVINEEQAKIVRLIFDLYISGMGILKISRELDRRGIKPLSGGERWHMTVVRNMLKNVKYAGDAILQKTVTADTTTFKRKKNEGEAPMYYVKDNHPAIIDRETFDKVQKMMEDKFIHKGRIFGDSWDTKRRYVFTGKITCGNCGGSYRHVSRNPEEWSCHNFLEQHYNGCDIGPTRDNTIKALFVRMLNKLWQNKQVLFDYTEILERVTKARHSDNKIIAFDNEISSLLKQEQRLFELKAKGYVDETSTLLQHKEIAQKIDMLQKERRKIIASIESSDLRLKQTRSIINLIKQFNEPLRSFGEDIFNNIVERITIPQRGIVIFHLKNGLDLEEHFKWRYGTDIIEGDLT